MLRLKLLILRQKIWKKNRTLKNLVVNIRLGMEIHSQSEFSLLERIFTTKLFTVQQISNWTLGQSFYIYIKKKNVTRLRLSRQVCISTEQ